MRTIVSICLVLVVGQSTHAEEKWKVQVDLVDGSRIVGKPSEDKLRLDIGFDKLEIPLQRVRLAQWQNDRTTVRVQLVNDDIVSGKMMSDALQLSTLFGDVIIPMRHCDSIAVQPANPYGWLPTDSGLVAYYDFDRPFELEVENSVGDRHSGKVLNAEWTELGKRGGGLKLNGNSQVVVAHSSELCPQQLTISAWIRPTGNCANYAVILGKTNGGSWSGGYAFVNMSSDPKHVHFYVNGYTRSIAKAVVASDKWSHLTGVCDGQTVKIFHNGQLADSVPLHPGSKPAESAAITHTQTPLIIGNDTSGYFWNGKIDEVALYSRTLNDGEIKRLYETAAKHRTVD